MNTMARTHHRIDWTVSRRPNGRLIGDFSGPSHSAGFIGRDSGGLSRSAFTETINGKIGVSWIRTAKLDVNGLSDEAIVDTLSD
jgi:hypothetical protein